MAIDVMSRANSVPIIVGDAEDMTNITSITAAHADGVAYLTMVDEAGTARRVELSPETSQNFAHSEYTLLVSLGKDDEITSAVLWPLHDKTLPIRVLDEEAIKRLAEDLVSGDFMLDFLR